jgi:uncharacterized membrane protein YhhN
MLTSAKRKSAHVHIGRAGVDGRHPDITRMKKAGSAWRNRPLQFQLRWKRCLLLDSVRDGSGSGVSASSSGVSSDNGASSGGVGHDFGASSSGGISRSGSGISSHRISSGRSGFRGRHCVGGRSFGRGGGGGVSSLLAASSKQTKAGHSRQRQSSLHLGNLRKYIRAVPARLAPYIETTPLRSTKIQAQKHRMSNASAPAGATPPPVSPPSATGDERILLAISLAAGLGYPFLEGHFGTIADIFLKGLAVSALALAATCNRGSGFRWLAAIMAAGALGDILLEMPGTFLLGGGSFALGHCLAIGFYGTNRRSPVPVLDRIAAAALILYGLAMPTLVMPAGAPVGAETLYSVLLCGMAAAMLLSRFAWPVGGVGALLFVVSDTFLIMRLGGTIIGGNLVGGAMVHGLIVWFTYYFGQALIYLGVSRRLRAGG